MKTHCLEKLIFGKIFNVLVLKFSIEQIKRILLISKISKIFWKFRRIIPNRFINFSTFINSQNYFFKSSIYFKLALKKLLHAILKIEKKTNFLIS